MASPLSPIDNSTISDNLCRKWLDMFSADDIANLKEKAEEISKVVATYEEHLRSLQVAKKSLDTLSTSLTPLLNALNETITARMDFLSQYGDFGCTPDTPYETMKETISSYITSFATFDSTLAQNHFKNLSQIQSTLAAISQLRSVYQNLAIILDTISNSYFKTEQTRRRPIVRELYRCFKYLADVSSFDSFAYLSTNPLLEKSLSASEIKRLMDLKKAAVESSLVLKFCR